VGRVVVIGEAVRTDGFALAGAEVRHAEDGAAAAAACAGLGEDVVLVVLTPAAADGVAGRLPDNVLSVVMPP